MISIFIDERGVATITLERAEKHNALCAQMLDELKDAVTNLSFNKAVRVVVLTGAGRVFVRVEIWNGCVNRYKQILLHAFGQRQS